MSAQNSISFDFPIPIGAILPYAFVGTNKPAGFLLCDGSAVSKAEYPELWQNLGDLWGASTATDFILPDMVNKYIRGVAVQTGNSVAGNVTGTLTWTLTENNLPANLPLTSNLTFAGNIGNDVMLKNPGTHSVNTNITTESGLINTGEGFSGGTVTFNSMSLANTTYPNQPIVYDLSTHFPIAGTDPQLRGYGMAYIIKAKNYF